MGTLWSRTAGCMTRKPELTWSCSTSWGLMTDGIFSALDWCFYRRPVELDNKFFIDHVCFIKLQCFEWTFAWSCESKVRCVDGVERCR